MISIESIIIFIVSLLLTAPCFSAEFLVLAKNLSNDAADTSQMSEKEKQEFDARQRSGDIVVVRPDGWQWGAKEQPPTFFVIKIPGMTVDEAKVFEESAIDATDPKNPRISKFRKYALPEVEFKNEVDQGVESKIMTQDIFELKVVEKLAADQLEGAK